MLLARAGGSTGSGVSSPGTSSPQREGGQDDDAERSDGDDGPIEGTEALEAARGGGGATWRFEEAGNEMEASNVWCYVFKDSLCGAWVPCAHGGGDGSWVPCLNPLVGNEESFQCESCRDSESEQFYQVDGTGIFVLVLRATGGNISAQLSVSSYYSIVERAIDGVPPDQVEKCIEQALTKIVQPDHLRFFNVDGAGAKAMSQGRALPAVPALARDQPLRNAKAVRGGDGVKPKVGSNPKKQLGNVKAQDSPRFLLDGEVQAQVNRIENGAQPPEAPVQTSTAALSPATSMDSQSSLVLRTRDGGGGDTTPTTNGEEVDSGSDLSESEDESSRRITPESLEFGQVVWTAVILKSGIESDVQGTVANHDPIMTSGRAQYKIKLISGKKKLRYIEDVWLLSDLPETSEEEEDSEVYRPLTLQEAGIAGHECWAPSNDGSIEAGTVRGRHGDKFLFVRSHDNEIGSFRLEELQFKVVGELREETPTAPPTQEVGMEMMNSMVSAMRESARAQRHYQEVDMKARMERKADSDAQAAERELDREHRLQVLSLETARSRRESDARARTKLDHTGQALDQAIAAQLNIDNSYKGVAGVTPVVEVEADPSFYGLMVVRDVGDMPKMQNEDMRLKYASIKGPNTVQFELTTGEKLVYFLSQQVTSFPDNKVVVPRFCILFMCWSKKAKENWASAAKSCALLKGHDVDIGGKRNGSHKEARDADENVTMVELSVTHLQTFFTSTEVMTSLYHGGMRRVMEMNIKMMRLFLQGLGCTDLEGDLGLKLMRTELHTLDALVNAISRHEAESEAMRGTGARTASLLGNSTIRDFLSRAEKIIKYIDTDRSLGGYLLRRAYALMTFQILLAHMLVIITVQIPGYDPRQKLATSGAIEPARSRASLSTSGGERALDATRCDPVAFRQPPFTPQLKAFLRAESKRASVKEGSEEYKAHWNGAFSDAGVLSPYSQAWPQVLSELEATEASGCEVTREMRDRLWHASCCRVVDTLTSRGSAVDKGKGGEHHEPPRFKGKQQRVKAPLKMEGNVPTLKSVLNRGRGRYSQSTSGAGGARKSTSGDATTVGEAAPTSAHAAATAETTGVLAAGAATVGAAVTDATSGGEGYESNTTEPWDYETEAANAVDVDSAQDGDREVAATISAAALVAAAAGSAAATVAAASASVAAAWVAVVTGEDDEAGKRAAIVAAAAGSAAATVATATATVAATWTTPAEDTADEAADDAKANAAGSARASAEPNHHVTVIPGFNGLGNGDLLKDAAAQPLSISEHETRQRPAHSSVLGVVEGYDSDATVELAADEEPTVLRALTPSARNYVEHAVLNMSQGAFIALLGFDHAARYADVYMSELLAWEAGVCAPVHGRSTGRLAWTAEEAAAVYTYESLRLGLEADRDSALTAAVAAFDVRLTALEEWRYGRRQQGALHVRTRRLELGIGTAPFHEVRSPIPPRLDDLELTRTAYRRCVPCAKCRRAHVLTLRDIDSHELGEEERSRTYHCHGCGRIGPAVFDYICATFGNSSVAMSQTAVCSWCEKPAVWPTAAHVVVQEAPRGARVETEARDEHLTPSYSSSPSPYAQSAIHLPGGDFYKPPEVEYQKPHWSQRADGPANCAIAVKDDEPTPPSVHYDASGIPAEQLGLSPTDRASVITILHDSIGESRASYGSTAGEVLIGLLRWAEADVKRRYDLLRLRWIDLARSRWREIPDLARRKNVDGIGGFPCERESDSFEPGISHDDIKANMIYTAGPMPDDASISFHGEWVTRSFLDSTRNSRRFLGLLRNLPRDLLRLTHLQVAVALVFGVNPPAKPPVADRSFLLAVSVHPTRGAIPNLTLRFALEVGIPWYYDRTPSPLEQRFERSGAYHLQLMRYVRRPENGSPQWESTILDVELMEAREGPIATGKAVAAVEAAAVEWDARHTPAIAVASRTPAVVAAQEFNDWLRRDAEVAAELVPTGGESAGGSGASESTDDYECVAGRNGQVNSHVTCGRCHRWGHDGGNCGHAHPAGRSRQESPNASVKRTKRCTQGGGDCDDESAPAGAHAARQRAMRVVHQAAEWMAKRSRHLQEMMDFLCHTATSYTAEMGWRAYNGSRMIPYHLDYSDEIGCEQIAVHRFAARARGECEEEDVNDSPMSLLEDSIPWTCPLDAVSSTASRGTPRNAEGTTPTHTDATRVFVLLTSQSGDARRAIDFGLLRGPSPDRYDIQLPSGPVLDRNRVWQSALVVIQELAGYSLEWLVVQDLRHNHWELEVKRAGEDTILCIIWSPPPGALERWYGVLEEEELIFHPSGRPEVGSFNDSRAAILMFEANLPGLALKHAWSNGCLLRTPLMFRKEENVKRVEGDVYGSMPPHVEEGARAALEEGEAGWEELFPGVDVKKLLSDLRSMSPEAGADELLETMQAIFYQSQDYAHLSTCEALRDTFGGECVNEGCRKMKRALGHRAHCKKVGECGECSYVEAAEHVHSVYRKMSPGPFGKTCVRHGCDARVDGTPYPVLYQGVCQAHLPDFPTHGDPYPCEFCGRTGSSQYYCTDCGEVRWCSEECRYRGTPEHLYSCPFHTQSNEPRDSDEEATLQAEHASLLAERDREASVLPSLRSPASASGARATTHTRGAPGAREARAQSRPGASTQGTRRAAIQSCGALNGGNGSGAGRPRKGTSEQGDRDALILRITGWEEKIRAARRQLGAAKTTKPRCQVLAKDMPFGVPNSQYHSTKKGKCFHTFLLGKVCPTIGGCPNRPVFFSEEPPPNRAPCQVCQPDPSALRAEDHCALEGCNRRLWTRDYPHCSIACARESQRVRGGADRVCRREGCEGRTQRRPGGRCYDYCSVECFEIGTPRRGPTQGDADEYVSPPEIAAQLISQAIEGKRRYQEERGTYELSEPVDTELTPFWTTYQEQQHAEIKFMQVSMRLGGRVVSGCDSAIYRGGLGRRNLSRETTEMIGRWRSGMQSLEICAEFRPEGLTNQAAVCEALALVFEIQRDQAADTILYATFYIEVQKEDGTSYRHRTLLLVSKEEVLYYDAASLIKSDQVRFSVTWLVPLIRKEAERGGQLLIYTAGQANVACQGQTTQAAVMCNAITQVVLAIASQIGLAGTLSAVRCLQAAGPEALTDVARYALAQLWRNMEEAAAAGLNNLGDFMPSPQANPKARDRCETSRRAALEGIYQRHRSLLDSSEARRYYADRAFGVVDPATGGLRRVGSGEAYEAKAMPHALELARLILAGGTIGEYRAWEEENNSHGGDEYVDPSGLTVIGETTTTGAPTERWSGTFMGDLFMKTRIKKLRMAEGVRLAVEQGGFTAGQATEILKCETATKAQARHHQMGAVSYGAVPSTSIVLRTSADCAGLGTDVAAVDDAMRSSRIKGQWVSLSELDPQLLEGLRRHFGMREGETAPHFEARTGSLDARLQSLRVDFAYNSPPCPPAHTDSNGASTHHALADTRTNPLLIAAANFARGQPAITVIENVIGAETQEPVRFLRAVVEAAAGAFRTVQRRGIEAGVQMSSGRTFILLFNTATAPYADELLRKLRICKPYCTLTLEDVFENSSLSEEYRIPRGAKAVFTPPITGRDDAPTNRGAVRNMLSGEALASIYDGECVGALFRRFTRGDGTRPRSSGVYTWKGGLKVLTVGGMAAVMGVPPEMIAGLRAKEAILAICNVAPRAMVRSVVQEVVDWMKARPGMVDESRDLPALRQGLTDLVEPHLYTLMQPPQVREGGTVERYDGVQLPRVEVLICGGMGITAKTLTDTGLFKVVGYVGQHAPTVEGLLGHTFKTYHLGNLRTSKAEVMLASFATMDAQVGAHIKALFEADWLVLQLRLHDNDPDNQRRFQGVVRTETSTRELRAQTKGTGVRITQFNTGGCGDAAVVHMTIATITRAVVVSQRGAAEPPMAVLDSGEIVTHMVSVGELLRSAPAGSRLSVREPDAQAGSTMAHPSRQIIAHLADGRAVISLTGPDEWPFDSVIGDGRLVKRGDPSVVTREYTLPELLSIFGITDERSVERIRLCVGQGADKRASGCSALLYKMLLEEVPPLTNRALGLRIYQGLVPVLQNAAKRAMHGRGSGATAGATDGPHLAPTDVCELHGAAERALGTRRLTEPVCFTANGTTMRFEVGVWATVVSEARGRHNRRTPDESAEFGLKSLGDPLF